jgi:hypothetical protein
MKRPAFQFYPGDWLRDANLRICSAGARSLWIDMLCVMHQAKPYGHLVFNGKALDTAQLARMVGETPKDVGRWLKELEDNGVPSRTDDGVIYSRRMVKDEALRNVRAAGGHKGAAWGALGAEHGAKGGRPASRDMNPPSDETTRGSEPPLNPPPSSSSSSSSSTGTTSQVSPAAASPVDNPTGQTAEKAKARRGPRWWDSEQGIVAEGKRHGVNPRVGEEPEAFRQRVWEAHNRSKQAAA